MLEGAATGSGSFFQCRSVGIGGTTVEARLRGRQPKGPSSAPASRLRPGTPEALGRVAECATGWGEALTLLKFYVELGAT